MKIVYISILPVIIICTLISAVWAHSEKINPVNNIKTYQDMVEFLGDYSVNATEIESDEEINDLIDKQIKTFNGENILTHSDVNIFVVEVRNELRCYTDMFSQSANVKKVIKGDQSLINKDIDILSYLFFANNEENSMASESFSGSFYRNLMIPGKRYAVFCEKSEISDYYSIPKYRTFMTTFSCLALETDSIGTVDTLNNHYINYIENEFLVQNLQTANSYNEIKHIILKKFKIES
ncbi:MAG: hypothetical protein K6F71_07560 [Ruminococcus sp.]|uniref:hypothetical protein n=1 Tax=Ruminococcus sp. TaxID=41978 RepID=UPI0025D3C4A3|nr:hypothetical protein [Ruminococcus sp.]MCR5540658.1 hypothetical protein [Ruminococcus sp.]